jgi:hypothetical protein
VEGVKRDVPAAFGVSASLMATDSVGPRGRTRLPGAVLAAFLH